VVAGAFLCCDILSRGGGLCHFLLEAARNSHCLCDGLWRIRHRDDGAVLLLSRVSPAGRRAAGTHDVECLAPMSFRHGHSWQVNGSRCVNGGWFRLESLIRMLKKSASFVLASFRLSTYPRGYASSLHSLRPRRTNFLSILVERLPVAPHLRICETFAGRYHLPVAHYLYGYD
jgi:hypothetical protein